MIYARMNVLNEYGSHEIVVRVQPHDRRRVYVVCVRGGIPFRRQSGGGGYAQKWEYVPKSSIFDIKSDRIKQ